MMVIALGNKTDQTSGQEMLDARVYFKNTLEKSLVFCFTTRLDNIPEKSGASLSSCHN